MGHIFTMVAGKEDKPVIDNETACYCVNGGSGSINVVTELCYLSSCGGGNGGGVNIDPSENDICGSEDMDIQFTCNGLG